MKVDEKFTPEILRTEREQKGLSVEELGKLSGFKPETIQDYEAGWRIPSSTTWDKIRKVLNMNQEEQAVLNKRRKEPNIDTWITPNEKFTPKIITFSFDIGRCYSIRDTVRTSGAKYDLEINPKSGNFCIFKYVGQSGIHHKFIEIKGVWTRTYTNQQLIGKNIEEVANEPA